MSIDNIILNAYNFTVEFILNGLIVTTEKILTAAIYTLGCKVNFYESEAISEILASRGVEIHDFGSICDIYIINTCTVTADSDRKARCVIRRALKRNPHAFIAVTGCLAQRDPDSILKIGGVSLITGNEDKISIANRILNEYERKSETERLPDINILPFSNVLSEPYINSFSRTRAYIKIEDGCSSKCSYCIIPTARGPVRSKPREDILNEVSILAANGCKEVVLTGIEISSYQFSFSELLKEIDTIIGLERIRLGSLDPFFINKDTVDYMADVKKLCPHFHISLQSGSSRTLAAMKRKYNSTIAMENIMYLKQKFPDCNLFADIITGFPGETDEDFNETVEFIKAVRFLHLHIFPYSRRAGTTAFDMPNQVPENIKNQRAAYLSSLQSEIKMSVLKNYVQRGEKTKVLFETQKDGFVKGHSENFIEFICPTDKTSVKNLRGTIGTVMPVSTDGETITGYITD